MFNLAEKGLMAAMDPVEVADCDCRIVEASVDPIDSLENFHRTRLTFEIVWKRLDRQRLLEYDIRVFLSRLFAEVAELVDALGSGSSGRTAVGVRVPASALGKGTQV